MSTTDHPVVQRPPVGEPTDIILHIRVLEQAGQWAIGVLEDDGSLSIRTGDVQPQMSYSSIRTEAVLAAFSAILEVAAERQYVVLDVSNILVRKAIAGMLDFVPNVLLSETTAICAHRSAVVKALEEMPVSTVIRLNPDARSLVVSTDASIANGGQVAGLGWVIATKDGTVLSCGQKTADVPRCGDILTGELLAIRCAVQALISQYPVPVTGQGTVVIESDSRAALRLLSILGAGRQPSSFTTDQIKLAKRILQESAHVPIRFCWVKGHQGNEGNEAADRLAVLARRNREFKVTSATGARMFRDLRDELVAA
ncbi:RNAse HI domain-containing protein [Paeniglutamicibacter antarcticus]|uniref:RNAse HI domain-containing protein n=1 Tax=Arthrobacter terrae TaxID=2935737 RepID=A0A931CL78_9MICC|nr:ribonuclease H family protein [Arthrobacter terrae]MBG0739007.1 RNAse HI domain-containing protein [Arthrobacter terrae]